MLSLSSKSALSACVFSVLIALQGFVSQSLAQSLPRMVSSSTKADPAPMMTSDTLDESIFVFGGRYHRDHFGQFFSISNPEDVYGIALGYQKFFITDPEGWNWGLEAGVAGRFGDGPSTAEVWAGGVGRYNGWVLGDSVRISPSLTFGLSAVTDTFGIAKARENAQNIPANLLFYLAPEISFSSVDHPEFELFARAQHRSGAWGLTGFAPIDGENATMMGIRFKF